MCLNHLLTPELQFGKKDDRTVLWSATDFSDGEPAPYQFALRLKSAQVAEEFLAAVESARGSAQAPPPVSSGSLFFFPLSPSPVRRRAGRDVQAQLIGDLAGQLSMKSPVLPRQVRRPASQQWTPQLSPSDWTGLW